ncbi:actin-like ATPase domain-containing protein [Dendrothele bispora CBS 962.96]|uniref:Actin-like ATPase domain-containing protein n=1 Tax=Dendrothele bispora (strain CBS 962.96) TaxID=1314807 RepID=A0A4S8KKB9_DENBC|nr:actin-like ATPase domain-containing protein [Dendrothele bispora CBS 962.96]
MSLISSASEVNERKRKTPGVYFVTAFSGLLAPYWDSGAAGLLIGVSQYTNPSHIARATLEANHLKVDGGMTNGDLVMTILADLEGFSVIRPEMREDIYSSGFCSLCGSCHQTFRMGHFQARDYGNTKGSKEFSPSLKEDRQKKWDDWQRAVERSKGWEEGVDE